MNDVLAVMASGGAVIRPVPRAPLSPPVQAPQRSWSRPRATVGSVGVGAAVIGIIGALAKTGDRGEVAAHADALTVASAAEPATSPALSDGVPNKRRPQPTQTATSDIRSGVVHDSSTSDRAATRPDPASDPIRAALPEAQPPGMARATSSSRTADVRPVAGAPRRSASPYAGGPSAPRTATFAFER